MFLAGVLAATGLGAVSLVARRHGYRLGGTVTVALLAVYTLASPIALFVFLPSAALAWAAMRWLRHRTLLHGRDEFVAAVLAGAAPSLGVVGLAAAAPTTVPSVLAHTAFLGSILPGLAAYNVAHVDPAYRRRDLAAATGLYGTMVAAGLALPALAEPIVGAAAWRPDGDLLLAGGGPQSATAPPDPAVLAVLAVALLASEAVRRALGFRLGVVSLGLVAVYSLTDVAYLPLFVAETLVVLAALTALHRRRHVYGRALLGVGCAAGVAATTVAWAVAPVDGGFATLMLGVLAGVTAYNVHVTPGAERVQLVAAALAVEAVLLLLARTLIAPSPAGFPRDLGVPELAGAGLVVAVCVTAVARRHVSRRDEVAVLAASVLTGGDR